MTRSLSSWQAATAACAGTVAPMGRTVADLFEHAQQLFYIYMGPNALCRCLSVQRHQFLHNPYGHWGHGSVVLIKDSGVYWAGHVRFFVSQQNAHMHCYGKVPLHEAMSPTLGWPNWCSEANQRWPKHVAHQKAGSMQVGCCATPHTPWPCCHSHPLR